MAHASILANEAPSVLNSVNEFVKNSLESEAFELTSSFIGMRKKTVWSHDYMKLMLLTIDLGITLNRQNYIGDSLTNYRNNSLSQIGSLESVFKHYTSTLENLVEEASKKVGDLASVIEEINSEDEPQTFYNNILNTEKINEREQCKRYWRMLMVAYKTILDLTFKNIKLEDIYVETARNVLQKLAQNKSYSDFRNFCALLQTHQEALTQQTKSELNVNQKDLSMYESSKKLYNLRIFQFDLCKQLNLIQEGFQVLQDVHTLLTSCKYHGDYFIEYYAGLAEVFFRGGLWYFHAVALSQHFYYLKKSKASQSLSKSVTRLVLAALAVNTKSEEFFMSPQMLEKYQKFLGTRKTLGELFIELEHIITMFCSKEIRELFQVFTGKTDVYTFSDDIDKIFGSINNEHQEYSAKIKENCILTVLRLLGNFFCSLSFDELTEFTSFMPFDAVKKIILINKFDKSLNLVLDYENKMVHFNNNGIRASLILRRFDDYVNTARSTRNTLLSKTAHRGVQADADDEDKKKIMQIYAGAAEYNKKIDQIISKESEQMKTEKQAEVKKPEKEEESPEAQRQRIAKIRMNEIIDQKILDLKKEKVQKILKVLPDQIILRKKLSAFSDPEINQLELEMLADLEKTIKDAKKKKDAKNLKQHFLDYHFLQREIFHEYLQDLKSDAAKDDEEGPKYSELISANREKKLKMKESIESMTGFVNKYKAQAEELQKQRYQEREKEFLMDVTDKYRDKILEDARKRYADYLKQAEASRRAEEIKRPPMMGRGQFGGSTQNIPTQTQQPIQREPVRPPQPAQPTGMAQRGQAFVPKPDAFVSARNVELTRGPARQPAQPPAPQSVREMPNPPAQTQPAPAKVLARRGEGIVSERVPAPPQPAPAKKEEKPAEAPKPQMARRGEGFKK